ncbi:hypothetical protein B2J90_28520 (plasmid) [Bacillus tropicus]|uniref:hypothetical protein n=1 Tax=Bacillus tropicus TaxID=2026188 RepID=UPI000A206BB4|nr:hypothetical protein B2J90_28520 [Bacillus cereus]
MDKYQREGYLQEVEKIEKLKFKEGYLPHDFVAVAFLLLERHLPSAERFEKTMKDTDDLIKRAEKLLQTY